MNTPKLKNSDVSGSFQGHVNERAISGIPKGLLIQNEALARLVEYHANRLGISADDFLAKAVNSYVTGDSRNLQCSVTHLDKSHMKKEESV